MSRVARRRRRWVGLVAAFALTCSAVVGWTAFQAAEAEAYTTTGCRFPSASETVKNGQTAYYATGLQAAIAMWSNGTD